MSNTKITKLKAEVSKMESVYSKSSTSDKTKAILKKAIDKANQEIDKLERKAKAPAKEPKAAAAPKKAKAAAKKPASALDKLKGMIKRKKYSAYKDKGVDLKKDADRPALPVGKRKSKSGNTYYEYRANRFDVKQPPKRYPKLEDGGMMADGGYVGQSIILTNTSSPIRHRFIGKELVLEKKQPNGGFSAFVRNTGEKVPFDIFPDDFEQYAKGGMMAKGGKLEVGDMVMVDDSGYVKLFSGFDITKPAKIISKGKTKSSGKVVYFYGLEMADGRKPFNNAPEYKLTKVSEDGGMMAKGGKTRQSFMMGDEEVYIADSSIGLKDEVCLFYKKDDSILKCISQNQLKSFIEQGKLKPKMASGGMMAEGGVTEHGLKKGDEIVLQGGYLIIVKNKGKYYKINISMGTREEVDEPKDYMASGGMMADGGSIPNNYKGKNEKEVWDSWTYDQKFHFLNDHKYDKSNPLGMSRFDLSDIADKSSYDELPKNIKLALSDHISEGQYASGGYMYEGGGSLDIDSFADGGELKKNYLVTFDSQTDEYAPTTFQSTSVYDLMETLKATIPAEVEILSIEEMTPSMEMKYGGVAGY